MHRVGFGGAWPFKDQDKFFRLRWQTKGSGDGANIASRANQWSVNDIDRVMEKGHDAAVEYGYVTTCSVDICHWHAYCMTALENG
jgi:hypothetical protein